MKGLEKLTCIRLAEVLTQKGSIATDAITDALYAQDRHGESFVDVLVSGGHIAEWDLAKVVVENFQLPFFMGSSYEIPDVAKSAISKEVQFHNLITPLDVFDKVLTVVMPILTPFEVLAKITKESGLQVYPFVGLISENKKVLRETYPEFAEWLKKYQAARDRQSTEKNTEKKEAAGAGDDWMNMFDSADQGVREDLTKD